MSIEALDEATKIDEYPVCGEEYETAFRVKGGSFNVKSRMYMVHMICFDNDFGKHYAYVHGESQ